MSHVQSPTILEYLGSEAALHDLEELLKVAPDLYTVLSEPLPHLTKWCRWELFDVGSAWRRVSLLHAVATPAGAVTSTACCYVQTHDYSPGLVVTDLGETLVELRKRTGECDAAPKVNSPFPVPLRPQADAIWAEMHRGILYAVRDARGDNDATPKKEQMAEASLQVLAASLHILGEQR